jgi:glycosyltransferase involved in cell wall biosynthesis
MKITTDATQQAVLPAGCQEAPKRLLMIAYHFPPSSETGANRPYRFVRYLRDLGYESHVVTITPQDARSPWKRAYSTGQIEYSWKERCADAIARAVQRVAPYNDQLPWIPQAVSTALGVVRAYQPSAILSTAPPFATHLVGLIVKRLCGLPWVADFRDPMCDNPFRTRSWGWLWDKPVERLIASEAAAIIANTDVSRDMFLARYPQFASKFHLIWNGYDPERALQPRPIPARRQRVLVHAGSLYGQRHPSVLLTSLEQLIEIGLLDPASIQVKLIGHLGLEDEWIQRCAFQKLRERGCLEFTEQPVQPAVAAAEMTEADYLLLLDLNDRKVGVQVPAKIFEYIQIGRPILAFTSRNSPVERILERSGAPHVCVYPDASLEDVNARVLSFLQMPTEPVPPSGWFVDEFNGATQARRLAEILH